MRAGTRRDANEKSKPKTEVQENETFGTLRVWGGNANAVLVVVVDSRTLHGLREGMRHPRSNPRLKTRDPPSSTECGAPGRMVLVVLIVLEAESKSRV
jgi:hypothetical protein